MMSSSYWIERDIMRVAEQLGLRIELTTSDPYAHDAEYRIRLARNHDITPHPREILFQGSMDRCSDFVRGYLHGTAKASP